MMAAMSIKPFASVAATAILLLGCPGTPSSADAGADAGLTGGGGDAGVCFAHLHACDGTAPCCDTGDYCDPTGLCLPASVTDGASSGTSGGTDGGTVLPPSDGASWREEAVASGIVALGSVSAPSPALQLATGTGPGVGALLSRSADAGWILLPGFPPSGALSDVWADPAGDLFAVGRTDGGAGLLFAGTLDGGVTTPTLDGGLPFVSLDSVVGLGPADALAIGQPLAGAPLAALHLAPDGGLASEPLPPELTRAYRLAGGADGGLVYALALSTDPTLPPWVLVRRNGIWATLPEVFGAQNLSDLTVGPTGDVVVVGDDGNGNGLAFALGDGGFAPLPGLPQIAPLTAVSEPGSGELFVAAAPLNGAAALLRFDGGVWSSETLPADALRIDAIAGDDLGDVFAVGVRSCSGCPGYPLALRRVP